MCWMNACLQKSIWSWGRVYSQIQFLLQKYAGSRVILCGTVTHQEHFNRCVEQIKNNRTAKNVSTEIVEYIGHDIFQGWI
jgi:hypothetical protein